MKEENEHIDYTLIGKYLSGETTEKEADTVQKWIAERKQNEVEFIRIKRLWEEAENTVPETKALVDTEAAWEKLKNRIDRDQEKSIRSQRPEKHLSYYLIRAAAVLFIGVIIYSVYQVFLQLPQQVQLASETDIKETELPDRSVVTLNENSAISYPEKFKSEKRIVELKGEAYFEVEKAEEKPFIVEVPDARIEVLGTEFNVRAVESENEVTVTVQEGKVMLSDDEEIAFIILEPSEKGILDRTTGHIEKQVTADESEIFWKTRTLIFRDTQLSQVFETLTKLYDVEIEVKNKLINTCTLTAKFQDMNIEEILEKIAISFSLKVNKSGTDFEITGDGC